MAKSGAIYKVCRGSEWAEVTVAGLWQGAAVDRADGFIHFSTAVQVPETVARHFAGLPNLVLVEFAAAALGAALKWEPSRGGDLFPHLYGPLDPALATQTWALPMGSDGVHIYPEGLKFD